jgi:hypothetical protein
MSRSSAAPWLLFPIMYGTGILLIAMGLPLYRRRVPPNPLYGVRFTATMADERIWYDINVRGGRDLIAIGSGYLVALSATALLSRSWPLVPRLLAPLGPMVLLVVALVVDAVVLWRAAERLKRAHSIAGR